MIRAKPQAYSDLPALCSGARAEHLDSLDGSGRRDVILSTALVDSNDLLM
jgi:hypothetical protein